MPQTTAAIRGALKAYRIAKDLGLLETWLGQRLFLAAYFLYKRHIEDLFYDLTLARPELFKGGHIIDVGANVGYTSLLFRRAASIDRKVFSFEPDPANFDLLCSVVRRNRGLGEIVPERAAVGATDGIVEFWHNRSHHGDHRVLTPRFRESSSGSGDVSLVPITTLDHFAQSQGILTPIRFVKIDVQGYEASVCEGMRQILNANPECVTAVEFAPAMIRELGFDPDGLLDFFRGRGYSIYCLGAKGALQSADEAALKAALRPTGYVDLICSRKRLA